VPVLVLGVVVLAVLGVAASSSFFSSKDDATITKALEPGAERTRADGLGAVQVGNVLLLYSDERLTRSLRAFAEERSGQGAAIEAAGQAVLVRRRPNLSIPVTALTSTRRLEADGPDDPNLREFVDYWLGRGP